LRFSLLEETEIIKWSGQASFMCAYMMLQVTLPKIDCEPVEFRVLNHSSGNRTANTHVPHHLLAHKRYVSPTPVAFAEQV